MSVAFDKKHLTATFQLGTGNYGDGEPNTFEFSGLRIQATAVKAGGASLGELQMQIFGVPLPLANRVTTLGRPKIADGITYFRNNRITLSASSDFYPKPVIVFNGTLYQVWNDFANVPNVSMTVLAYENFTNAGAPALATSYDGSIDVATVMQVLAERMGLNFENNGVSVILSDVHFSGTLWEQAQAAARHAHINLAVDGDTLTIWPWNQARQKVSAINIAQNQGMIGYPAFAENGVIVRTYFEPLARIGCVCNITSTVATANGSWSIAKVAHLLSSEMPGGLWETQIEVSSLGQAALPK